ncbi:CRPV-364 [Crowpox virus]|nr:CRPV-364 [Crowpox virus]
MFVTFKNKFVVYLPEKISSIISSIKYRTFLL